MEHLTYDKNGNIQNLLRNGNMDTDGLQDVNPIDNLTYLYDENNKNLLLRVFDESSNPQGFKDDENENSLATEKAQNPDYSYDANGNMISDTNKGIESILYNHLNLPTKIFFGNGNSISYLYTALGQKVRKNVDEIVNNQAIYNVTDYLAGFQYHNAVLKHFSHAEGYVNVVKNASSYDFKYVFNYTDHLGNIRLSYTQDPETNVLKILEENHYYPFGLKHTGYNSDEFVVKGQDFTLGVLGQEMNTSLEDAVSIPFEIIPKGNNGNSNAYKYKYNGKEYQDELGLNFYDYGARNYDPALGRWMNVDPLAEKYDFSTPYSYVINNPLIYIDPDGMRIDVTNILNGQENGLKTLVNLMLDLSEQTGLSLYVNNTENGSIMECQKDDNGKELVCENSSNVPMGSETARNDIMKAINNPNILNVSSVGMNKGSRANNDAIQLDFVQIQKQIETVSDNLNNKTLGFGLTFLHELQHTKFGNKTGDTDNEYEKGPTVQHINQIRTELDANNATNSKPYGIRKYYMGFQSRTISVSRNYENISMIIRFSVMNSEGKSEDAHLKTTYNKKNDE